MQIQVFSIPMEGDEDAVAQLNLFLRTHKVLCIEKAPVLAQGRSTGLILKIPSFSRRFGLDPLASRASGASQSRGVPTISAFPSLPPPKKKETLS